MTWLHKILLAAGLAAMAALWYYATPDPVPVGATVPAKKAPELNAMPKQEIRPAKVEVYAPAAKKKLSLPEPVQDNPNQQVLESSKVEADDHPHTITTVIDVNTGQVQTYDRRDPLPWLAAEQRGELRLDYGLKNGLAKVARLSLREDLLQVKSLHAGINASLDTDGRYFVGAGVGWKW